MISWKMIRTLRQIKEHQNIHGVSKANQINTYKDSATKYRSLNRLAKINAIQKHEAPKDHRIKHTYTITEFGKNLIEKADKIKNQ